MKPEILIIDDDQELCEEMIELLTSEGYSVNGKINSTEGEKSINENNYNLLIMDLKMPGASGIDILKNIREKNIKIKVLIISGKAQMKGISEKDTDLKKQELEEENILKSADAFIKKPFNIESMLDKVRELLAE